jgi:type IV pilus assembly protein PilE
MLAQRGVTLLELLVTVAIASLLLTLAGQSYVAHQRRGGRIDATNALLEVGQAQERHYAQHGRYAADLATLRIAGTERGLYALTMESDGGSYTAFAAALGLQRKDEACATYAFDSDGRRRALTIANADNSAACWR